MAKAPRRAIDHILESMSGRIEIKHLRRRELIDAVRLVIARDGFEATTISKIATQAGFSIGFMHHHFPNKHALLAEAMRVIYGDMGRLIVSRLQEVTEPLNRLRVIVEGNFDDEIFTPANAFVWISYVPRVPFNPLFARLQRVIERRSYSNLIVECRKLFAADDCPRVVTDIMMVIDYYWLRLGLHSEQREALRSEALECAERIFLECPRI